MTAALDRCLSLWQPWAYAILRLGKRLENRDRTDGRVPLGGYVGPLLLHAAKRWQGNYQAFRDMPQEINLDAVDLDEADRLIKASFGCVGRARIVRWFRECRAVALHRWYDAEGYPCKGPEPGQEMWFRGRWAAELADVEEFETPIQCLGRQGLFRVPPRVAEDCAMARVVGL